MTRRSLKQAIFAWAWPTESVDQLLQAAAHTDDDAAKAAWRTWSRGKELDGVYANEMRLLAAVAPRLTVLDPTHEERNRIAGIERMLWSRSQVLLRQIQPALQLLQAGGIETMVLKGAARIARDPQAIKSRFVNDVDLLVHPDKFRQAFDLLDGEGWRSTGMGTAQFHRAILDTLHGVNLIRGEVADLDLHRSAFHPPHQSLADDSQMWSRSAAGTLAQCPTRVPSATDFVILALAHGGQSGHRTSDWLLDIAALVASGEMDWELFSQLVESRRLETPAAVSLTYLAEQLQSPVPTPVLQRLVSRAWKSPLSLATGLLLSRPKEKHGLPLKLGRIVTKAWRLGRGDEEQGTNSAGGTCRARAIWKAPAGELVQPVQQLAIRPVDRGPDEAWQGTVEVTLALPTLKCARRIEFELNTAHRHLTRVKFRKWTSRSKTLTLRFKTCIKLDPHEQDFLLEAAPGRGLRSNAPRKKVERYAPVPFSVVEVRCQSRAA